MARQELGAVLKAIVAYDGVEVDLLSRLVVAIRPTKGECAKGIHPQVDELIALLKADPVLAVGLSSYVMRLVQGKRFYRVIIDQGMPGEAFWYELRRRLAYKLLPNQPEKGTIEHVLTNVFFREGDAEWVGSLDMARCIELLELLGGRGADQWKHDDAPVVELLFSAKVLGLRISGKAFDSGVLRMVPEYENLLNPFVALGDALNEHLVGVQQGTISRKVDVESNRHVNVLITHCQELIDRAYRNSSKHGMGFQVNQRLVMMRHMLERLAVTLDALAIHPDRDGRAHTVDLVKQLIRFNTGSTRVLGFLDHSTQVMAREITHHTGRAGEHYITTSPAEYARMFRTALGGGFVVAFACVFKAWMSTLDPSLFGQAALYSLNYAWAFITIYLLHLTLATKQPAMTAATIAATLDRGRGLPEQEHYDDLALLLARVWRSQFVAFAGNVFMAFPLAVALAYGWNFLFGTDLFAHKSAKLLGELDPFLSLAVPHAMLAGIFLFLSGLISGSVVNRSIHLRIPERFEQHPVLKLTMSDRMRARFAKLYAEHAGGVISNFWFGVFMGSIGVVGVILGLPLDIRHITFAAGNLGLGLVGAGWQVDPYTLVAAILGIGLIGFFNFIVSFGLSLALAMHSRNVPFTDLIDIGAAVWERFKRAPLSFFFPPRKEVASPILSDPPKPT